MNKWKNFFENMAEKLQFLKLDDESDHEDDLQIEERPLSSGSLHQRDLPEGDLKEKLAKNRKRVFRRRVILLALVICVVGGFALYNSLHTFSDYVIVESIDNEVSAGTCYESVGKNIFRYNSDGISCVNRKNELKWSITYNMQAPIADVCGNTMAVAEQQGNQIYVVNQDGLVGNFETLLPVLKVRASEQGVVAAVLQEENITWVNLYQADGTTIASNKTTITESGYPLDMDVSPDGQKLAVTYLKVDGGVLSSQVIFYHFGTAGQSEENHIVFSENYGDKVMPEIYFTGNSSAVAVSDCGFVSFRGSDAPKQSAMVEFTEEIISMFHDDERIGFLFESTEEEYTYRMELYNYRGKRKCSRNINAEFDEIKIENGQILMYNDNHCDIFTMSGRKRFSSAYEKNIEELFYFSEFRKYMVVTQNSFDRIRIG